MSRRELEAAIAVLNAQIDAIMLQREVLIRELMEKRVARHGKPKIDYRPPPWVPRSA